MKDEYIIINKTAIQKRIEELEKSKIGLSPNLDTSEYYNIEAKINLLKEILSQSTPLIPEIEKALKENIPICDEYTLEEAIKDEENYIKWYISNLKLGI